MPRGTGKRLSANDVAVVLRLARESFRKKGFVNGSPAHTSQDFWNLELISHEDQLGAIGQVLMEISEANYRGPHPPNHQSGEPKCKKERMVQFRWTSEFFEGEEMYFKFCMVDGRLVVLRLHADCDPNRFEG